MRSGLHSISKRKKKHFFLYLSWWCDDMCLDMMLFYVLIHFNADTDADCIEKTPLQVDLTLLWCHPASHLPGQQTSADPRQRTMHRVTSCRLPVPRVRSPMQPWPCVCVCAMRVCLRVLERALCLMPAGLPPCRGHKACSLSPASFSAVWGHWCQNGRAAWAAAKSESVSHRILEFHQLVDELAGRGGWGGGAGTYGCGFDSEVR